MKNRKQPNDPTLIEDPEIEFKDTKSAIKNKLINLLSTLLSNLETALV